MRVWRGGSLHPEPHEDVRFGAQMRERNDRSGRISAFERLAQLTTETTSGGAALTLQMAVAVMPLHTPPSLLVTTATPVASRRIAVLNETSSTWVCIACDSSSLLDCQQQRGGLCCPHPGWHGCKALRLEVGRQSQHVAA